MSGFFGYVMAKNAHYIDNDDFSQINQWHELLMQKDQKLVEYPTIIFIPTNNKDQTPKFKEDIEIKSDFSTFYAIRHFHDWRKIIDKEVFGHKLSNVDPVIFTLESICDEQDWNYYPERDKKSINISNLILDYVVAAKEEIIKNKWHDDKSFTNKLFSSKRMQLVMKDVEPENLEKLFTIESLGTIIKKANSHENIKSNPALLGNLLALASAEKWMEGWTNLYKSKSVNLVDLFNNKFHASYGVNITDQQKPGLKKEKPYISGSSQANAALKDEMTFFFPAIVKMEVDSAQLCQLFNGIMKSRDVELMSLYLDYFDIPHVSAKEDADTIKIHSKMMEKLNKHDVINYGIKNNTTGEVERKQYQSWMEACAEIKATKLGNILAQKTDPPGKRTLKI